MKRHHSPFAVVAGLLLVLLLSACEKDVSPLSPRGDYYPVGKGSRWEYTGENGNSFVRVALGDTLLNDTTYAVLGTKEGWASMAVRYENGRYYQLYNIYGQFGEGHVFLRDDLPVGGTWTNEGFHRNEVYTIVAKDAKRTVEGREYANTLEVKIDAYNHWNGQTALRYTHRRIYARGVGEVALLADSPYGPTLLTAYQVEKSK
jgi:hypothetical protein